MNGIILLDFEEKDKAFFEQEKIESYLFRTSDFQYLPVVLPEVKNIFFQMNTPVEKEAVPADLSETIRDQVKNGSRLVGFIGQGYLYQLTGVIGAFPDIHLQESAPGDSLIVNPELPFNLLFDRFFDKISFMYKLLPDPLAADIWEFPSTLDETWKIVAKSADGYPVSVLIKKGKGFIWLLPWFGQNNIQVADFILRDVFPLLELQEKETEQIDWADREEYVFPEIKQLYQQKQEEKKKFEEKIRQLDEQIKTLKATEQEAFIRLLKAEGKELKTAALNAFKYLGWTKAVDVDEYWKNVIRDKEEDIWLIDNPDQSIEVSLQKDFLILVVVRSSKNWASDDDCIMLQRFKGRRMQEFENTRMKGLLLGNYFNQQEARLRNNPFSQFQIEEAEKDGNALLTTYELFKAIKAEKEGLITKEEIRRQIRERSGLIQFNF
ncbi:MAG TPA: hypothetical protein PLP57_05510 [Candidatus Saccharicenans sp.]|jgi:hypothetical protein|nr:hypothetical protein [Candidatus Saccharicenans sp.]HRD02086.1 hypothetical protein [Candidatus Saccharicenans sp.]